MIAQVNAKRGKRYRIKDFVPDYLRGYRGPKRMDPNEIKANLKAAEFGLRMFAKQKRK